MKKISCFLLLFFIGQIAKSQTDAYTKTIKAWQKNYVAKHEVVKGSDKQYFRFFPIDGNYYVTAAFVKIRDTTGFKMMTSDGSEKVFYKYGTLKFSLFGTALKLFIYQSKELMKTEKYKDYLFVPFSDKTNGDESYGSGRYLEYYSSDIKDDNTLILDFNGAYNPYCAYGKGYHCPIPPKENYLPVSIRAGEMIFGKKH